MGARLSHRVTNVFLIAFTALVFAFLIYFFVSGHWQILTSNIRRAKETIALRAPIIRSIESFRDRNGHYPRHVEEFVGDLKPEVRRDLDASPFPSTDWRYLYLSDHDYRLMTTTCHFISSYDAVVYQRSENYPAEWRIGNQGYPVEAGYYLIGAQRRMELGEMLFPAN